MLIRSMSPDVLIVDEIGRREDMAAVLEAVNAGIKLVITAHGRTLADLSKRPYMAQILNQDIFERFIELNRNDKSRFGYTATLMRQEMLFQRMEVSKNDEVHRCSLSSYLLQPG